MEIRVDVTPQMEAGLLAQARTQGMSLDAYVQSVIERIAAERVQRISLLKSLKPGWMSRRQHRMICPVLPSEAFTRDAIYEEG